MSVQYSESVKDQVRHLYLSRHLVSEITQKTGVPRRTIYDWIRKNDWDCLLRSENPQDGAARRLLLLIDKPKKTPSDLREIELMTKTAERWQRLSERQQTPSTKKSAEQNNPNEKSPHEPSLDTRSSKPRKPKNKKKKNDFRDLAKDEIEKPFLELCKKYQLDMYNERHHRIRQYLKSRQIGMTFEVAGEILVDALCTGQNKICLSGSKSQVDVIKDYIKLFAYDWYGVEIKGSGDKKIELVSDFGRPKIYFLSTNAATAQSYHGDVYIDEYFWIKNFSELNKVASAMATHDHLHKTYFSTPSSKSHEAYPMWSGEWFQERRRADKKPEIKFPTSKSLEKGQICPDGHFRKIITVHNAIAGGADFFNLEQLKQEYAPQEFRQLFECEFIDDTHSVFKFSELETCLTDSSRWPDVSPTSERPFLNHPVWLGYDPSRSRDGASMVVIAPPLKPGGIFRVLEKITLHNQSWQFQVETIKKLTEKYNVQFIGIDASGCGHAVFESVQAFYPRATPIIYSLETKTNLVLKAQDVITHRRIQWDAQYSDIAAGFLCIHRATTRSGQITYVADRTEKTGHADAAWAVMHALSNEHLNFRSARKSTYCFG